MTSFAARADASTRDLDIRSLAFPLIFLAAILPVLAAPVLPMIDYYSHIARYYVLAHVDNDPFLTQLYEPRWAILPNIGIDIIGVGLMRFLPPLVVAKVIVLLIFAAQYFGILAFSRQLNGKASLVTAILAAALLYSFIFTWGFANFLMGLGLVFWAAAWWLKKRDQPKVAIPVACLLAVLIFFCHGVAFALYGLLLGGLELGFYWQSKPRRPAVLLRPMASLAVQAVLPAILFMMSPTAAAPDGVTNAGSAVQRLAAAGKLGQRIHDLIIYRLTTIVRVSETAWPWLDVAAMILVVALLAALALRGRIALNRVAWPAIGIGVMLVVFVPPDMLGVGNVADRMPLFLAFLLVGALTSKPLQQRPDRFAVAALAGIVLVRLVATGVSWQGYGADLASLRSLLRTIPAHSIIGYVNAANGERTTQSVRCEMFGPLMLPLGADAVPLFAYASQQPIALKGRVKAATDHTTTPPTDDPLGVKAARRLELIARTSDFDYALICNPKGVAGPIPASMQLVAQDGRLALYRLAGTPRP